MCSYSTKCHKTNRPSILGPDSGPSVKNYSTNFISIPLPITSNGLWLYSEGTNAIMNVITTPIIRKHAKTETVYVLLHDTLCLYFQYGLICSSKTQEDMNKTFEKSRSSGKVSRFWKTRRSYALPKMKSTSLRQAANHLSFPEIKTCWNFWLRYGVMGVTQTHVTNLTEDRCTSPRWVCCPTWRETVTETPLYLP